MTCCLLDYLFFKKNCKFIAIDLRKQRELDANPKVIQQINFTRNIEQAEGAWMVFILKEVKETILDFSQRTVRTL